MLQKQLNWGCSSHGTRDVLWSRWDIIGPFFLNWNLLAIILPIFDVVDGEKWKKYAWNYSCPTDRNF